MSSLMQFKRAVRTEAKLKILITGASGSGKTLGALALAKTLAGNGTVAVIDTENGSASLYADRYAFDVLNLAPPFTSARYLEAMEAAASAGYAVLVIDSLSHQWNGEGGILARKEELDKRPGSNSYTNWATFTKEHTAFVGRLVQLPVHVIGTLRSKQDYVLETNDKGKQQPKKVGMAPVQREGLEYEFSTVFDVQMDHRAAASKDRTGLFGDELVDLVKPEAGKRLLAWLASVAPIAATMPAPEDVQAATNEQKARIAELLNDPALDLDEKRREQVATKAGKPGFTAEAAGSAIAWLESFLPSQAAS